MKSKIDSTNKMTIENETNQLIDGYIEIVKGVNEDIEVYPDRIRQYIEDEYYSDRWLCGGFVKPESLYAKGIRLKLIKELKKD